MIISLGFILSIVVFNRIFGTFPVGQIVRVLFTLSQGAERGEGGQNGLNIYMGAGGGAKWSQGEAGLF